MEMNVAHGSESIRGLIRTKPPAPTNEIANFLTFSDGASSHLAVSQPIELGKWDSEAYNQFSKKM